MLFHVSAIHFLFLLSGILLHEYNLSVYLLIDIWVVSSFWPLCIRCHKHLSTSNCGDIFFTSLRIFINREKIKKGYTRLLNWFMCGFGQDSGWVLMWGKESVPNKPAYLFR